jgi:hypothetical protein
MINAERCTVCGCAVHREGRYGLATTQGRSHASEHHFVATRLLKRRSERPWFLEQETIVCCYECHEELLHNPVLLPTDLLRFALLIQSRGLNDDEKLPGRKGFVARVQLLQEVIAVGIKAMLKKERQRRQVRPGTCRRGVRATQSMSDYRSVPAKECGRCARKGERRRAALLGTRRQLDSRPDVGWAYSIGWSPPGRFTLFIARKRSSLVTTSSQIFRGVSPVFVMTSTRMYSPSR